MKKKHLLFVLLSLCLSIPTHAQWLNQGAGSISNPNFQVFGLGLAGPDVIWAIAWDAVNYNPPDYLLKTNDGGATWTSLPIDIPPELYTIQVFVLDEMTGWLAMADELDPISGKVYKTTDGGLSWVEQSTGFTEFNETPAAVHFWNANEGVAFGATCYANYNDQIAIYTTEDGGDTWTKVSGDAMPAQLPGEGMCLYSGNGFYEVVGNNIWFVSSKNRVFKSADRGHNWIAVNTDIAAPSRVTGIAFKDELNGIVVAAFPNKAARTTDGGLNWTPIDILNVADATQTVQVEYIPGTKGSYLVHNGALIWITTNSKMLLTHDDGDSWETFEANVNLNCVEFLSPRLGFGGGKVNNATSGGMYKWAGSSLAGRIYVKSDATGANTGFSWDDAFVNLQDALAEAVEGDEIWVAAGTYTPDGPGGAADATFLIDKNIQLLGGFAGNETDAGARDPMANLTILSGDLNGDDVSDDFATNRGDNVMHVITITNAVGNETLIDGFTVSSGHAGGDAAPASFGGGIYSEGTPQISHSLFTQNFCNDLGGALILINTPVEDAAVLNDCSFINNKGNAGGAVCLRFSAASFDGCIFEGNTAKDEGAVPFEPNGGAIQTRNARLALNNCSFRENISTGVGGAFLFYVDPDGEDFALQMDSCVLEGNQGRYGSAVFSQNWGKATSVTIARSRFKDNQSLGAYGSLLAYNQLGGAYGSVWVDQCVFEGNSSQYACGAIEIGSGPGADTSEYAITNCTFRGNMAQSIGGALGLWSEVNTVASFLVDNCRFEENLAGSEAGAIWVLNGSDAFEGVVSRCAFVNNAAITGSAISTNDEDLSTSSDPADAKLTIENCLAIGNIGDNTISLLKFPNSSLFNCTIADNLGGSIQLGGQSGLELQNTILYNPGYLEYVDLIGDALVTSLGGNLISDNSLDDWLNNTDQPATSPLLDGDYQLTQNSPAVDAGVAYDEGAPEFDLAGNSRQLGSCIDIGAFESPFDTGNECKVVTGTRESLAAQPLGLFPNPASDILVVSLPERLNGPFKLQILDAQGRILSRQTAANNGQLDVASLPPGLYWAKAIIDGLVYTGRFVKL
ncbi:MAG: T9SS type A sorting domain-containing protein [Lewinellaceae bacterium]|nr:T9SS type A sorting domain-containing protein [Lewinellaceae bacterium]